MGFLGLLRFSLLCFDFLAWPALALGYPLWASIRAIETSSKDHMRKLVTYWTIFSLTSLFEIFFVKLIQWVPFWPYIKLLAIFWLVIPRFDGACHVYQCLIDPCLSVDPQDIANLFCTPKEKASNDESSLASAETNLRENRQEALEELIASKAKVKEQILTDADALEVVNRVEKTEKAVKAGEQLVKHPKPHLLESEKKETAAAEVQRLTIPAERQEKRPLEIHALKKVQKEWTCAMCQVTTTSEALLNAHLFGKKHKAKNEELKTSTETVKYIQSPAAKQQSEELKTSTQAAKNLKSEVSSAAIYKSTPEELKTSMHTGNNLNESSIMKHESKFQELKTSVVNNLKSKESSAVKYKFKTEEPKTGIQTGNHVKSSVTISKGEIKHFPPVEGSKQNTTEKPKSIHIKTASGQQEEEKPTKEDARAVKQQIKLWCSICNISCPGEIDMAAHLNGKKHFLQLQSKLWCGVCNIWCSGEIDMAAHLKGKRHLFQTQSLSLGASFPSA